MTKPRTTGEAQNPSGTGPVTFQKAIQAWLDFKWPKRYLTQEETADGNTVSIRKRGEEHIMCIGSDGETCLSDNRKDRMIKIVPLADPKYFKQLHSLMRQRR